VTNWDGLVKVATMTCDIGTAGRGGSAYRATTCQDAAASISGRLEPLPCALAFGDIGSP
jgi:hypothetical protein